MHRTRNLILSTLLLLVGCLPRSSPAIPGEGDSPGDLERLATFMAGSFSSREQHLRQPDEFFDIRLRMAPIWTDRSDGYWLYVEQAVAQAQERPYRQRVYHLLERGPGLLESRVYALPDPRERIGAWREPAPLADLAPEQLLHREGCAILLRPSGPERFTGNSVGRNCASSLNGASYAVAEVTVTPEALISWDQGFDDEGNQVWGPAVGGYVFRKLESFPIR